MSSSLLLRGADVGDVAHRDWTINAAAYGAIPPQPNLFLVLDVARYKAIGVCIPDIASIRIACYVGSNSAHRDATTSFAIDADTLFVDSPAPVHESQEIVCPIPSDVQTIVLLANLATTAGLWTIGIDLFTAAQQPSSVKRLLP